MHPVTQVIVAVAAVAVIVVCAVYMDSHITCFNFMGVTKGCVSH